jgi:hypothetical protein
LKLSDKRRSDSVKASLGAKQVAEKLTERGSTREIHPSEDNAPARFAGFIGTDKSVPFQNIGINGIFPQPVKPTVLFDILRHG